MWWVPLIFFVDLPKLFRFCIKVIWQFVNTSVVLLAAPKPSHILLQVCFCVQVADFMLLLQLMFSNNIFIRDPLCLLAGCCKRRLNQAPLNLRGFIWLLMMDWSERGNIRKRGLSWEPFCKNSALCSWQANQSWFKERRNPQAPNGRAWGKRKKHYITVRDLLLRFLTSSRRFS